MWARQEAVQMTSVDQWPVINATSKTRMVQVIVLLSCVAWGPKLNSCPSASLTRSLQWNSSELELVLWPYLMTIDH